MTSHQSHTEFLQRHSQLLNQSYQHWLGKSLLENCSLDALFNAPFALVSHGIQDDPIFNYGNALALKVFGYTWDEFTNLASKHSAEPINQATRSALLKRVAEHGYVDDYNGIRIAKDGTSFLIENATVWNLLDEKGAHYGQAAMINAWAKLGGSFDHKV